MGEKRLTGKRSHVAVAASEVKPSAFIDYSKFLDAVFEHIKKNVSYTYHDFSYDLGFGSTTYLHQIIRRYRTLTSKNAEKIAGKMDLTGSEKRYFINLVQYVHSRSAAGRDAAWQEILKLKSSEVAEAPEQDILEYFSQWYHPVIREYLKVTDHSDDMATVSKELVPTLRPEQVRESFELLERLKLIEKDEATDKYRQTSTRVSTGHRVKSHAVVNYHLQMINLARDSLVNVPGKQRDISALTLSVSEESFGQIKAMIHTFQLQLLEVAEKSQDPDKVVQLNIQMFPVSKKKKNRGDA